MNNYILQLANALHRSTRFITRQTGRKQILYATTLLTMGALLFAMVGGVWARPLFATAPTLGTAASYAVLGGQSVTNTGPTVITGNLGVSPGSAVTGFPPGIVVGEVHAGDAEAVQAQADNTIAYLNLAGQPCTQSLTDQDLGGKTLTTGVYCFSTSAQLTGPLILDAQGDPNAVFIFQMGSTLTTASNSSVQIINGGSSCNIYWQVGSSATLGTQTTFVGNILALTSITMNTSATMAGRALARNGSITMDSNTISAACVLAVTPVPSATPVTPVTPGNPLTPAATPVNPQTPVATPLNPLTPVATPLNPLTPVATPLNPLTPVATPLNPLTPVATPLNPLTPVATPVGPIGEGTPQSPSALDPVGQPNQLLLKLYIPFGAN
jgi:type VI secretion system secreted protein VgrG